MRPIEFRAWGKNTKLMYYNVVVGKYIIVPEQNELQHQDLWEFEIMQYIGLKDKKRTEEYPEGQKIYEGDIFDYRGQMVIVEYVEDMFHLKSTKYINLSSGNYRLATLHSQYKIIGNIYENPELLKEVTNA